MRSEISDARLRSVVYSAPSVRLPILLTHGLLNPSFFRLTVPVLQPIIGCVLSTSRMVAASITAIGAEYAHGHLVLESISRKRILSTCDPVGNEDERGEK